MNLTSIEWCDYTLNPIVGCTHGCNYCYAERLNKRFSFVKNWREPEYFPERLTGIGNAKVNDIIRRERTKKGWANLNVPLRIFLVSMGDILCEGVKSRWVNEIINMIELNPEHEFMLLTKNPEDYRKYHWPTNVILGATITGENTQRNHFNYLQHRLNAWTLKRKTFISIEPILGTFKGIDLSMFNEVILGAMTGAGAVIPEQEWIESIHHENIFFKNNIKKYMYER